MSTQDACAFEIAMLDSVGAHRGLHYYNFALVSALNRIGASTVLVSTTDTASHSLRPDNVSTYPGFRGIYGDRQKWQRGLSYIASLVCIARWISRIRPTIAHFHFYQIPVLDYLLLRWLDGKGVKTVTTVHDVLPFELGHDFRSIRARVHHRLYTASAGLILNSRYAYDTLARLDPSLLQKATIIPQGGYAGFSESYALPRERAKAAIGVSPLTPVVLVFGTIKPNKRLDLVISALAEVIQSHPETVLVIAGQPQNREVSGDMALAERVGVATNVLWRLGIMTDEELAQYLSAADVVVFPYEWVYQSAALLMAMSFRKAIVATAVGSNANIIDNARTGVLVPVNDPAPMAAALQACLDDPARALGMGDAAHDYIATELSWDKIAQATLDFYRKLG